MTDVPENSLFFYFQATEIKRPCRAPSSGSSEEVEQDQHEESEIMEESLRFGASGAADKEAPEGRTKKSDLKLNRYFRECSVLIYSF